MSRERQILAGAEAVREVEGNMSGAVMRGFVALPWSKTSSRAKGSRRNLGDLQLPHAAVRRWGRIGKVRSRSRSGALEESDGCIVPVKPRTKPVMSRRRRVWREGGRSKGRYVATPAPGSVPDLRRSPTRYVCGPAGWVMYAPECRSRSTFGRSPVRESRTPGSARGAPSNGRPYRHP